MERSTHPMFVALSSWFAVGALALAIAMPAGAQQSAGRSTVVVVRGLRNDRGALVGGLYTSPRVWLGVNRAAADCHASIRAGEARCTFEVQPGHRVAFAAMHDEDGDGELDRDLLGLPQEGYAFSNDVREPFGPPSFEAAAFLPPEVRPFVVHARYGI